MIRLRLPIVSFGLLLLFGWVGGEILKNSGFESGISNWKSDGFNMVTDSGTKHGGVASAKCTGRTAAWQGPGQVVPIVKGRRYSFRSYIKLISDVNGHSYQTAAVKIRFHWRDGSEEYFPVGRRPFLKAINGWSLLGGDFQVPYKDMNEAYIYVEGLSPGASFYFDDTSLTEIPANGNWEQEANQRIEKNRKSNIHFKFNVPSGLNLNDLQVQIDHTKHLFGFGSMVRSENFVNDDYKQYQNIVYHMFNWVTNEDFKWQYDRGTQGHPDYSVAVAATNELKKNGMKVRAHCMFWAVPGNEPSWVTNMRGTQLKNTVDEHIKYMTSVTKGKVDHWDVDNELTHGHFFEDHTGDPYYSHHMFREIHQHDSKPTLFLNDYDVVATGQSTIAYLDQIYEFKGGDNVNLGAVGVQSHFPNYMEPDPTILKIRLDHLAEPGLPIWITELDLAANNDQQKADWYERVLRLYFSHPSVEGVVLWGFWDHDVDVLPLKALVHGYTFSLDEAGRRFLHLTKEEWSTHVKKTLSAGKTFTVRGFQGDYDVVVTYQGKPIKRSTFSLGKGDKTVTINIDNTNTISLPQKIDPFKYIPTTSASTSQGVHKMGSSSSNSGDNQLRCETKWSGISAVGDDKSVEVSCGSNQVLTSCSSHLKNNQWQRDGEQIRMDNGRAVCRAIDGFHSTAGVQAVARCCSLKGLSCAYMSGGPSGRGIDDQLYMACPNNDYHSLGCSTWAYNAHSDGSFFHDHACISQNDDPASGVFGYAACCEAPNLQCQIKYSAFSGKKQGDTTSTACPNGQVMTGCNVFSKHGKAGGAYINYSNGRDSCVAVNGAQKYGAEQGVQAIASCCHV